MCIKAIFNHTNILYVYQEAVKSESFHFQNICGKASSLPSVFDRVIKTCDYLWRLDSITLYNQCHLNTLVLLDGPFSFSSLSSVSPRLRRSSLLTLRSRWDTCQKATQPHRANSWARHTQFTAVEKHTWTLSALREQEETEQNLLRP